MKRKRNNKFILLAILAVIVIIVLLVVIFLGKDKQEESTPMFGEMETEEIQSIELGQNLEITEIGNYTGAFVEDGSNENVTDVMAITVKNSSKKDLQYAEIYLQYTDFAASFEVSNLPAGESVLLLEQNRSSAVQEEPSSVQLENVVFFNEAMSLNENLLEVSGLEETLNVKNISGQDIVGDIYIYYKNCEDGLYYGGITYRTKIAGGIEKDGIQQVITQHYLPEKSRIIMVDIVEAVE